jgi:hypothetical protein
MNAARLILSVSQLWLACLAVSASAFGAEYILTPQKGAQLSLEQAKGLGRAEAARWLFSSMERSSLSELGQRELAQALVLKTPATLEELQAQLKARGIAASVEPNARVELKSLEREQWALRNRGKPIPLEIDDLTTHPLPGVVGQDIGLPELGDLGHARNPGLPQREIRVAVLDTGIDLQHPDLQPSIAYDEKECEALTRHRACLESARTAPAKEVCEKTTGIVDANGNGYPLDCAGWNASARTNPHTGIKGSFQTQDDAGHGTHVAGIIAADPSRDGVRGVAWRRARIIPVKVVGSEATPRDIDSPPSSPPSSQEKELGAPGSFVDVIARGLLYAIKANAQIINMSLGWPSAIDSTLMRELASLAERQGILLVAAAGNDSTDYPVLPCLYPGVVCVASYGPDGAISNFSNFGSSAVIAAPGTWILSTWPMNRRPRRFTDRNGYEFKHGTSMAAPYVAGALAYLMANGAHGADGADGIGASEALARIAAGARAPLQGALPGWQTKTTLTGNLDLAGALAAKPQPWLMPVDKGPLLLGWNRRSASVRGTFHLRNYWQTASQGKLKLRLLSHEGSPQELPLSLPEFTQWGSQQTRRIEFTLPINDSRIGSEIALELEVAVAGQPVRRFPLQAEIRVPLETLSEDSEVRVLPVKGSPLRPSESLRSVSSLDGQPLQEFFAVEEFERAWAIRRIEKRADSMKIQDGGTIVSFPGETSILSILRLDFDLNGSSEHVLVTRMNRTPDGKEGETLRFVVLDGALRTLRTLDHDNTKVTIPENFQWLRLRDRLTPCWISMGELPALDLPPSDPWEPQPPKNSRMLRLYYLADDGLRSISLGDQENLVQLLQERDFASSPLGSPRVILSRGSDFRDFEFYTATIEAHPKRGLGDVRKIDLREFRLIEGLDSVPLLELSPGAVPASELAFAGQSMRTTQRLTVAGGLTPEDFLLKPTSSIDVVRKVVAAYRGKQNGIAGAFSQTQYDLLFHDFRSGQTLPTSLRRFSFLPNELFEGYFYPVTVADSQGGESIPALYTPGFDSERGAQILLPHEGRLIRPAKLNLDGGTKCSELNYSRTHAVFFCGDHLREVELRF